MHDDEDVFGEHDAAPAAKSSKPPKASAAAPATIDKKGKGRPNGVREAGEEREVGTDVKSLLGRIKKLERTVYEVSPTQHSHMGQPPTCLGTRCCSRGSGRRRWVDRA